MSDRFGVQIAIGGTCTREVYDDLMIKIEERGPECVDTDDGHLSAYYVEVSDGCLEEVELFCTQNRLEWHKHVEGKYEYDPACIWWRPGMDHSSYGYARQDGEPLILASDIETILNEPQDCLATAIRNLLGRETPPEIQNLKILEAA